MFVIKCYYSSSDALVAHVFRIVSDNGTKSSAKWESRNRLMGKWVPSHGTALFFPIFCHLLL